MATNAILYHAGCSVCLDAEQHLAQALDRDRYALEIVHLGESRDLVDQAARAGVKSVPALVLDGAVYHINYGADLSALR